MKIYGNWSKDEALFYSPMAFGLSGRYNIDYDMYTLIVLNGVQISLEKYDAAFQQRDTGHHVWLFHERYVSIDEPYYETATI